MKKSTQILQILFMNVVITLTLCVFAQMLSVWRGDMDAFYLSQFLLNIPIAYAVSTVVGLTVPCVRWGMSFAEKCKALPGTVVYALVMNVVVNTVYTVVLSVVMTFVNVYILAHMPIIVVLISFAANFVPIWILCYIVSFLASPICLRLARKCTGDNE